MRLNDSTIQDRLAMVESWKQSGLSIQEYCRLHRLSYHSLRYWHHKIRRSGSPAPGSSPVAFVPLKVRSLKPQTPVFCEVIHPGGWRLIFPQGVEACFLKTLLD